ncbi:uncharacterized protein N7483_006815 [Penicillium malachiteum]|uniref:uncharacterized protein n=1 Tax=Penicillium malachiteum TaxID=1324776 RepID=UPI002546D169|nr:uncharacterized protein N7483_006815 [Penicillium malachiteum]KAJ5725458.1 hypothetical protein N7483_006815 [Penicillium malachiteum]
MKFEISSARAVALVALFASVEAAHHGHYHGHHEPRTVPENTILQKKSGQCEFPSDAGLIAVTPSEQNAGWAMSPNQPCEPGNYCPYACPPGQVSMQWDPEATSYSYPMSMNGGLYCDENGDIQKPFPSKPYCEDGTGFVSAINKASQAVSFCQTVLPGNEAMLIPTLVEELATLAVPGMSYWCSTAAQFYINAPGISVEEGCIWGTSDNPVGNWSPYTAGANTDGEGNTYVKIGWNPIYLEPTTPFRDVKPEFGIEIECDGDDCEGLPCRIDPSTMGVNEMSAPDVFTGAGGATGCVVTASNGSKANIVVFELGGSDSSDSSFSETVSVPTSTVAPSSTIISTSTSTSSSTSISTSTSTSTPTSTPTTTSTTETPTTSSTSTATPTSSASSTSTHTYAPTFTATPTSFRYSSIKLPMSSPGSYTYRPQVFNPSGDAEISSTGSATGSASPASTSTTANGASSAVISMISMVFGAVVALAIQF